MVGRLVAIAALQIRRVEREDLRASTPPAVLPLPFLR
jgi:hypothetical protein